MALAFTNRASQFITTNATSYVSSTSFTPTAGNLMVLVGYWSSTDTAEVQPTSVSGNGVTYSQHATTQFISGVCSGAVWVGIVPASPTLGSVTVSGFGTARTGISFQIWEISGADTTGTALAAIAQVFTASGTATSGSVTMTGGPLATGNLACGYFDHTAAETISAGTGCTLDATGSYATPNRGAGGVHDTTTYANPAASWTTSAAWRGFGVEIKAASSNQTVSPPAATASASAPIGTPADQVPPAAATAAASSPLPVPQLRVSPAAATASASAPIPTVTGGAANQTVSPPVATASASAPLPTLSIQAAAPAATSSASAPIPTIQLRVAPAAATAAASAPTPLVYASQLVAPPVASASASAPIPIVTTAPVVAPPAATAAASAPTPTLQLRVLPPAATASASAPIPAIQLRLSPPAATAAASSPGPSLQLRLTPGSATAAASAFAPTVSATSGGGSTPPVTVRTFLAGSNGHTWARSGRSATRASGASGILALTGASGATHATGTSGKTVV